PSHAPRARGARACDRLVRRASRPPENETVRRHAGRIRRHGTRGLFTHGAMTPPDTLYSRPIETENAAPRVRREATYFEAAIPFFGWVHHANTPVERDCVAVICAPLGHEYT